MYRLNTCRHWSLPKFIIIVQSPNIGEKYYEPMKGSGESVESGLGLTSLQVQSIDHSTDDSPMGRTETS